jgi:transcriptional regulator with XRE-family HTH domain
MADETTERTAISNKTRTKAAEQSTDLGDPVLAERVKQLRGDLGLTQAEFANLLKVNRTQVGCWERGERERPSIGKIIEMASLAITAKERIWLWERAGVNLDLISSTLREKPQEPTTEPDRVIALAEQIISFRTRDGSVEAHYSKEHDAIILRGDHSLLIRPRSDNAISVVHKRGTRGLN